MTTKSIQQILEENSKAYFNARGSELKLAQVATSSNRAYFLETDDPVFQKLNNAFTDIDELVGEEDTPEKPKLPKIKVRILGEHSSSTADAILPWAYLPINSSNPAWDTGKPFLPQNSWVYVYLDNVSGEYFVDRVSPNSVCKVEPKDSGFNPGDNFWLVPDDMFREKVGKKPAAIPDCAEIYGNTVQSLADAKLVNVGTDELVFSTWCTTKDGTGVGDGIKKEMRNAKIIQETLNKQFQFLKDFQTGIDNAIDKIEGDPTDTTTVHTNLWKSLRNNDVTLQTFNNTIGYYQQNLKKLSIWIVDQLVILFMKMKQKILRQTNVVANAAKGLFPNSARKWTNEIWDNIAKAIACAWNYIIRALPGLVDQALTAFFQKFVNTANCLIENFIGGFLGQLLGQLAGLINAVWKGVISALSSVSGLAGSVLDLVDSIGKTLDTILNFLKCEFECIADENNVVRYSIIDGAKPDTKLDFMKIWDKAKDVAKKFDKVTDIPDDIENFEWKIDIQELLDEMFGETTCNSGPIFCGDPIVEFWGVKETVKAVANAVVDPETGELVAMDIVNPGQYNNPPNLYINDPCGNGKGGTGIVIIGPITGIGTVGVATTGGLDGSVGDLDDPTYPGDGGQGTTAGIGITYHVTVNAVAVGNRFFINDKQQKTLTFERGNTYILNQEHVSNNGHPLRFSETKDGAWVSGGKEYTRGVTIDGIPGLGKSATDTAYSRMVVDNNTPERLYYYCENHKKMGGVINVITSKTITKPITETGRDGTVEIAAVNTRGGAIALKNLKGGTGYNECMANVPTKGGNGTGLTLEIVKTNGGSIQALSINNKGSNYQIGDIVTITSRLAQPLIRPTTVGVTKVVITNSGYGYLSAPDGSQGGDGRTWANRCETVVRRKNLDWDAPYSEGEIITLYSGDWIKLPGKPKVYINEDFNATQLAGAQVTGVSSYIPKDMSNFPISSKEGKKSINFDFTTATLIDSFRPNGLYDWQGNGPTGVARTDGASPDVTSAIADWNFYLNGEYLGEFNQNSFSEIPQIVKDDVVYKVGIAKSFTPSDPFGDQTPWVRTADVLRPTSWVLSNSQGWSPFLKNYGVYPAIDDPKYKVIGTSSAIWRVATYTPGTYTFNVQADNVGTIEWRKYNGGEDWQLLGSTLPYAGHNRMLQFQFSVGDIEPAIYEIRASIENKIHRDGLHGQDTYNFETNPAAIAWTLQDPYGAIVKTSLDEYGVPDFAEIFYGYDSYYSIMGYNIQRKTIDLEGEWFDCATDYENAKLLGFSDCDIRHFLENNPEIKLDSCMQTKLDDDNWGNCDGDLMVSLTAPGCPPPPCLPTNTYPVILSLDEIYIQNPGFGFDCCKDTVKIEPSNGAKAKIEECIDGEIRRIVVTDGGAGFKRLPEISINTETGYNAILKPIMKVNKPEEIDVPEGTNVIQVVDCVGKVV